MADAMAHGTERYVVTRTLGQGGMGAVYCADDLHTGASVALKRLRPSDDEKRNRSFVELFHQEYRTLAQLAHPNVVSVHDFGTDAQGPYYTMELLDGEDLHALSPLPWREVCGLLRDVCSAVALLHSRRLLHRDLSPKNVQRTQDGRAKLIDFGAMAPMGPCKTIVGTPPLVPPEALLQQPLEARADLFALGGTLYFALTGRHAYPARHIAQLRAVWRTPPLPPSAYVPGIPPELDKLVLSLLSLEPMARPASAAEVLERLAAVASLPRHEQLAVSYAYLSTPELVGRGEELSRVRMRLTELHTGRGGVLSIEGAPGMGRTRMLDSCVLEAKLAGMAVVRASAADSTAGAYGAVSALVRQLREMTQAQPELRSAATGDALALLEAGEIDPEVDRTRRAELQAVLQAQLAARARAQPLLVAVDDIERCDEPSQAALAAAAAACARDRLLIAVSCTPSAGKSDGSATSVMLHAATKVRLSPLEPGEVEALTVSLFGDAANVQGLAARIHERAEGSPRGCMELCQYLLDHGLVRYEMGSWVVPPSLAEAQLPFTLSAARRQKLEALCADAREIAEALAFAAGSGLDFEAYVELTSHGDRDRLRSALDALLLAQIVRNEAGSYVFEAQLWHEELREGANPERARVLCVRIADALQRRSRDRLELARYLFLAGQAERTVDTLLAELATGSRWDRAPRDYAEILRWAADACVALRRPRRDRVTLLRELVKVGQDLALPDLRECSTELFAELRRDSGLDAWESSPGPSEPAARLQHIFELAQKRYDAAPDSERGLAPLEAIIALARQCAETCAVAAQTGDVTLFELIPSLEPFKLLSPAIERVDRLTLPSCRAVVAARYEEARTLYQESLAGLSDPTYAGVDEELRLWGMRALHYALGCIEAGLGRDQALEHAEALESAPGWLVPAYSVRQIYHLTLGNLRQAERFRKQIELQLLQSTVKPPLSAGAVHQHLFVFALADNPNAMRRAIPELESLAVSHAGLRPFVSFARAEHARICGNHDDALAWLERMRESVRPGEHPLWPWLMSTWLSSLLGLERYAETREIGLRELETAARIGLDVMRAHIEVPLALAEAKLGDLAGACARLDRVVAARKDAGMQGVVLGWVYEARARVALWMDDDAGFEHYAQLCAQQFKKSGGEPALAAKYEHLMQEGRHHGLQLRREVSEAMATRTVHRTVRTADEDAERLIGPALAACHTREQRMQRALELLKDGACAAQAELFLLGPNGLQLAAATAPELGGEERLLSLTRLLDIDSDGDGDATVLTAALTLHGPPQADGTQTNVWPLLIADTSGGHSVVAGIAALHYAAGAPVRLPLELANAIAAALIAAQDVEPRILTGLHTTERTK